MLKLNWKIWLAVLVGMVAVPVAFTLLLSAQGAQAAAQWVGFLGGVVVSGWVSFGLIRWREVGWVKRVNTFVITTLIFSLAGLLFRALGWETGWKTSAYLFLAVLGFLVGINVLRLLLRPGHPILGVARTMLEEALRMGIALIFIIALFAMLVILPLGLGSEDRVTYMVQRFLVYSTAVVFVLLGLMTVLLSARTVSLELSSRQAHMTLTKPITRWQYLLGKWLGIVLLDAVLVAVAGVAIYGFTMGIARNPALNDLDRFQVDREILTARLAMTPDPIDIGWEQMYQNVLTEKQLRDPDQFGTEGTALSSLPNAIKQEVMAEAIGRFYTVDGASSKQYRFTGLQSARLASERSIERAKAIVRDQSGLSDDEAEQYVRATLSQPNELKPETIQKVTPAVGDEMVRELEREKIQLVLTPDTSPEPEDQFVEFYIRVNNQPWPRLMEPGAPPMPVNRGEVPVESPYEVNIPASMIDQEGTLVVTIEVPRQRLDGTPQPYVQFNYKDAQIELYYRVGSFEVNLLKAMAVLWLKLCFLAMLGLAAGALLSFPVAAMLGLVVFVAAWASGAIDESLADYASTPRNADAWTVVTATVSSFFTHIGNGAFYDAFRVVVRIIGEGFMLLVPSFGKFNTSELLSTGRVIGLGLVFSATWKIGLMWTGIVGAIGLYFFHRREIARVTV